MFKTKAIWAIALTPLLLGLSGCHKSGERAMDGQNGYAARRMDPISASEQKIEMMSAQLDAITVRNEHGTLGGKNPGTLQHPGYMLDLEFIYWDAYEDDLAYALFQDGPTAADAEFHLKDVHFKFKPGFRVSMGYNFGCFDQWDFTAVWTWFRSKASGSVSGGGETFGSNLITPLWMGPLVVSEFASSASGHWTLLMNVIDVELGRNFFVSRKLSVRPSIGPRIAFIHQNYVAEYKAFIAGDVTGNQKFRAQNDFNSGGLRAGFDMQWHFNKNWNIMGKLSGSLLYGHFEIDEKTSGTDVAGTFVNKFDRDYNRVRANWDIFFGLQYEKFLFNNRHHLAVTFGYELAEWLSQNEMLNLVSENFVDQHHGDLGTQGINLKFMYNF